MVGALLFSSVIPMTQPAHAAAGDLNMMSWNVQGKNLAWSEVYGSANTVVGKIQAAGAEYVGLQEISGDQANTIATRLGWGTGTAHVLTQHEHGGVGQFREGIAMISKYPMTETANTPLSPLGRGRHLQHAKITKDGRAYHVYNTHLGSNDWSDFYSEAYNPYFTDGDMRNKQAQFIRDRITALKNQVNNPAVMFVLGGDMNSRAANNTDNGWAYKTFTGSMKDTWRHQHANANTPDAGSSECHRIECGNTVSIRDGNPGNTLTPTIRIDHFFVYNGNESSIKSTHTPTNAAEYKTFSDHFPYRVVLGPATPVANFTASRRTGAGNQVYLDGSASYDPDGSITSWTWNRANDNAHLGTGRTLQASLGNAPSVAVKLTVRDTDGLSHSVTKAVQTPNRTPVITTANPNGGIVGSTTPTLTATGKDDDGDPMQFYFRVTGPLVDINSGWVGGSWRVPDHRLDPGTQYTWTVKVRDTSAWAESAPTTRTFTVAMLPTANELVSLSTGNGYWEVAGDGGVFSYGAAQFHGSLPGLGIHVNNIIGMARTPTDKGYWLVGKDGGVFAFGDAPFYGSLPSLGVNVSNIVGMAPTKDGKGYWLVGSDGGVFAFGNAGFFGSMGGQHLNKPVQAIAPTASSRGYWLAAEDGGVFAFGDAPFYGSMGGQPLNYPVVDIDATPDGKGYWLAAQDGGIFAYGNAGFYGSMGGQPLNGHINSMSITPDGKGYWLNGCDGGIFAFGTAPFYGSQPRYSCRGIWY